MRHSDHRRGPLAASAVAVAVIAVAGCTASGQRRSPAGPPATSTSTLAAATPTGTSTATVTATPTGSSSTGGPAATGASSTGASSTGASTTDRPAPAASPAAAALLPAGGPVPAGFRPLSATFISDSIGWVLGSAPCTHRPCTSILRTTDGGRTWRGVPAPKAESSGKNEPDNVTHLSFADAKNGYAYGQALWTTHDGGAHWARQRTIAGVTDAKVDELIATARGVYAVLDGSQRRGKHLRLVRAATAGGTFTVVKDYGRDTGDTMVVTSMVSAGRIVYLVVDPDPDNGGRTRLERIDGSTVATTALPHGNCAVVAASTATALDAYCGNAEVGGAPGSRTLEGSTDSGATWRTLPGPSKAIGYNGILLADGTRGHAMLASCDRPEDHCNLVSTVDGGQTWPVRLSFAGLTFGDLGYEDAQHGIVLVTDEGAPGRMYRTADGGRTFHRVSF